MHQVKVQQFEGPLDLLLQLIEEQKLDITQLSLATVTEQFLVVLQQVGDQLSASDLADFLTIAARLLLIKSRALLPYLQPPDADDGKDLEQQLKLYREFFLASQQVNRMLHRRRFSFARERLLLSKEPQAFAPPPNLTAGRLATIFVEVVAALPPQLPTSRGVISKTVSIHEKIKQLRDLIWRETRLRFSQLLGGSQDRMEVIISFLAILELMKQRTVTVQQEEMFQEIVIEKIAG